MADALSAIPAAVLRNVLSDKLYEKRNNAAYETEGIVKQLTAAGDHDRINSVINLLTHELTYSPQTNHRKGSLIDLAAATVALSSEAAHHLQVIGLKSVNRAKKACHEEEGSDGKSSVRSYDADYPFDTDSHDADDVDSEDVKDADSSVRKSFNYGTLAYCR